MSISNAAMRIRVHRAVAYWRPILGLESWDLLVKFDEPKYLACCVAKPSYEEAVLSFNLTRMRAELPPTYAAVEELAVHELVHALLWRCSEREVSRVTRSLLRAHDDSVRRQRSRKRDSV